MLFVIILFILAAILLLEIKIEILEDCIIFRCTIYGKRYEKIFYRKKA